MNAEPKFLSIEDVLALHAIAIEDQGGDPSIRDHTLLESAVATPKQRDACHAALLGVTLADVRRVLIEQFKSNWSKASVFVTSSRKKLEIGDIGGDLKAVAQLIQSWPCPHF